MKISNMAAAPATHAASTQAKTKLNRSKSQGPALYQPLPGVKSILLQGKSKSFSTPRSKDEVAITNEGDGSKLSVNTPKEVSFHKIHVAEYEIMLGDSPYAEGPPLRLGHEKLTESTHSVHEFESARGEARKRKGGLRLSAYERSNILLSRGYSLSDVAAASIACEQSRIELAESLKDRRWDSFRVVQELATRGLRKLRIRPKHGSRRHSMGGM